MYLFNHIAENNNAEVQQKFNRLRFEALLFLLGCPITQLVYTNWEGKFFNNVRVLYRN